MRIECYLPPDINDFPAFTPAEDGTQFSDLKGCKAELTWVVITSQEFTCQGQSPISEITRQCDGSTTTTTTTTRTVSS